jgi:8-oxo-dGTP pyrophosphatase MutT (NUDIX family)
MPNHCRKEIAQIRPNLLTHSPGNCLVPFARFGPDMALSTFATIQYNSEQFVESCGAILFDFRLETAKVCLIHYLRKDEWLLAKGRRNCNEPRYEAALREIREETGYRGRLYPVSMPTRATPVSGASDVPDQARASSCLTEPFMLTFREIEGKSNVKLIWWYIAEVDQDSKEDDSCGGEEEFAAQFFPLDEAVTRLTFQNDRDILSRAVSVVRGGVVPSKDVQSLRE